MCAAALAAPLPNHRPTAAPPALRAAHLALANLHHIREVALPAPVARQRGVVEEVGRQHGLILCRLRRRRCRLLRHGCRHRAASTVARWLAAAAVSELLAASSCARRGGRLSFESWRAAGEAPTAGGGGKGRVGPAGRPQALGDPGAALVRASLTSRARVSCLGGPGCLPRGPPNSLAGSRSHGRRWRLARGPGRKSWVQAMRRRGGLGSARPR